MKEWVKAGMKNAWDFPNKPKHGLIPDILNRRHRYIIEIDGSWHLKEDSKARDKIKDERFAKRGYAVFRVVAYDRDSFLACVLAVRRRRVEVDRTLERRKKPSTK